MRTYFMKTKRLGFSIWREEDLPLAELLWGDAEVTRYICAAGRFSDREIEDRLRLEIRTEKERGIQYWPVFLLETGEFAGCCGLRPFGEEPGGFETGFHFRKKFWGTGLAFEAGNAAAEYAFRTLDADWLFAGHHPENKRSAGLLKRLGFAPIGARFYEPTGRMHPSYEKRNPYRE